MRELTDPETGIDVDEFLAWKALYRVEHHEQQHAEKVAAAKQKRTMRGR